MDKAEFVMQPSLLSLPPAQIWVGAQEILIDKVIVFLQHEFCKSNACGTCVTCLQIRQQQFYATTWLIPENQYTVENINIIFDTIAFKLDAKQKHFFIIQKADLLTTTCANSLLKSLEEPPTGYHFILLTQRLDALLDTIRSRCTIQSYTGANTTIDHEQLYLYFTSLIDTADAAEFLKQIDQSTITESDSAILFDEILRYWITQYKQSFTQTKEIQDSHLQIISLLQKIGKFLPMPGSSKLFWKNLFLQVRT